MMDINVDLLHLFIYFLTKSLPVVVLKIKRSNQELVKNCTKQSLENLKNGNYTYLLQTIYADLADTQLKSKFNKGIRFLLCVIDIFSKYAWVISLKDKRGITITNTFPKKIQLSLIANQPKYGWIKAVNFKIDQ